MARIISPRITLWANSTSDPNGFFPATGWLPTEKWLMLRWQFEFNSQSDSAIRIGPAYQFTNDMTTFMTSALFSNASTVYASLPSTGWNYSTGYVDISDAGTTTIGAFVRFGFHTMLSSGTTLTYARLRFAADGRE